MLGNRMSKLGTQQVAWGASTWVRPAEWIALPTLTAGEEKLVGLYRVNDAANQCVAFTVTGDYTVDWDDGSAPENVASGVKAEHSYTFADIDPATETGDGWRQAIITITPQAGAALTTINLTSVHAVGTGNYTSWWLDVAVVGAGVTQCLCGGMASATRKPLAAMEQFEFVGTDSIANFRNMFYGCSSLSTVPALDTSSGTSFGAMFSGTGRIASSGMTGPKYSHSYATNLLIQSEIVTIFTNLGIAPIGTGQTITVTGNPGAAGLTGPEIAIATAKNWTVVN